MPKNKGIQLVTDNGEYVLDLLIKVERDAAGKIYKGLSIGNTLEQNKALILIAQPGEIKSRPDFGVGIEDMTLSDDYLEFRQRIRQHFAIDGLNIQRLNLYENKPFIIIADYE